MHAQSLADEYSYPDSNTLVFGCYVLRISVLYAYLANMSTG